MTTKQLNKKRLINGTRFVIFITILAIGMIFPAQTSWAQAEPVYNDGGYIAVSDADPHGYVMAVVLIQDGQIASVRLTEMTGQGDPKPATYPWPQFHEAMEVLPGRFIEANNAEIDIYTGATSTSAKAMQAVERALLKATNALEGKYFDGTFFGRSAANETGYGTALVTIKDDEIVEVVLGEVNADGSTKDYDTYPHEITVQGKSTMEARFVEAGHENIDDVDIVTGATGSSTKWKEAVNQALTYASID